MTGKFRLVLLGYLFFTLTGFGQDFPDIYPVSSGEFIFSDAKVILDGENQETALRFSFFFHYGQFWHFDMTNNLGFYCGGAIRNVGFITRNEGDYDKIKRRSYSLGAPIAIKFGSFKDHFFVYAGGEYEWMFHYKQKFFNENGKQKSSEWFSNRANRFIPSIFGGIQFPKGLNVRFKYYLDDFLNRDYSGMDFGNSVDYSTYKTQMFYISVSFDLKTKKILDKTKNSVLADCAD